jgi:tetratricopeptide (TPR) repeat protein
VKRALGAAAVLTVVLLAVSGVARAADPNAEKARAHFQQGDTYFKLDRYANALQEFEQAYLAKQDPSFLYNIAQCHRLMGNRADAIRFYKRYLNDAPTAANRPVAEKHIRDLESALGAGEPTGAHVAPAPGGPGPGPNAPGPGTAALREAPPTSPPPVVALDARPPSASDAMLTAPAPPSQSDDHPIYTKWWFWTGVGGVVVAGLLVALAVSANRDPSCPGGRNCQ